MFGALTSFCLSLQHDYFHYYFTNTALGLFLHPLQYFLKVLSALDGEHSSGGELYESRPDLELNKGMSVCMHCR